MSQLSGEVKRYAANERWNHWFTAILFVLLAASGLAFFHPAFGLSLRCWAGAKALAICTPFLAF